MARSLKVLLLAGSLGCAGTKPVPKPAPTSQPRPAATVESRPTATEASGQAPREEAPASAPSRTSYFDQCFATKARLRRLDCWLPALENYVPSVQPGNQAPIDASMNGFASYANQVHKRVHVIFADKFLSALASLPPASPMNQPSLYTTLELVLDGEHGGIARMGVVRSGGVTAFDLAALESVYWAQPFGTPPPSILSSDGKVYFHWEFHRGVEECGAANARPFILKSREHAK